jgi:hypothetical protein
MGWHFYDKNVNTNLLRILHHNLNTKYANRRHMFSNWNYCVTLAVFFVRMFITKLEIYILIFYALHLCGLKEICNLNKKIEFIFANWDVI